tara:strand:- start:3037 stop:3330 length:294 start_codon:yes stop_codon:yes gene_type:complete
MLIETPYSVGDTISIKISSGEEMVARLDEIKDDAIIVKKPFMLVAGQKGPGLAPFMFTVAPDAKFELKLNTIICIVKTAKDASDMYIKATTGLTVAK